MLIDAAIDGQGIALARTALAASDLINGRLARPFDGIEIVQYVLDRLSEGDCDKAEDRDVSGLAVSRSDARRLRKLFSS
jgi:LysR family glycine cleavage system transcriptional activator